MTNTFSCSHCFRLGRWIGRATRGKEGVVFLDTKYKLMILETSSKSNFYHNFSLQLNVGNEKYTIVRMDQTKQLLDLFDKFKNENMKKGLHPQLQWISYVTQSGRLINVMMTKIHNQPKVYHFRAKRQMAQSLGQIAKFKRRYEQKDETKEDK